MADPFATVGDLANLWRPLSTAEQATAAMLLTAASAIIRARVAGIDDRLTDGTLDPALPQVVTVEMVRRRMVNPDGALAQSVGPYSVSYHKTASTGLVLTDEDRALLETPAQATDVPKTVRVSPSPDMRDRRPERWGERWGEPWGDRDQWGEWDRVRRW